MPVWAKTWISLATQFICKCFNNLLHTFGVSILNFHPPIIYSEDIYTVYTAFGTKIEPDLCQLQVSFHD